MGENIIDPELKMEIHITTDEEANTLTITDSGIGMTRDELVDNLGTIARSGSKAFIEQLKQDGHENDATAATGIIGKFGVGFYSAFMVGDNIDVYTRSARSGTEDHVWSSDGTGTYQIVPSEGTQRGSKIVIHLKDSCKEFAKAKHIESVIRKYSNFVSSPIFLNNEPVNTIQALWTMDTSDITEDQYTEFYKYIANAFDDPMLRLNFRTDAPIELKSLFFIGSSHMEKHGFARLEPGVSLYSRKVLIERNSKHVLPDWMRFVKGVVDSEDLPLSLSRETMQDSQMLSKIRDVLTRRILRFLDEQSRKEPEKFAIFYKEYSQFLKEGICSDFQHKDAIAKLMRYESSTLENDTMTTLDEYISRCTPEQDKIYYLYAPTREMALNSPYYESFKKAKTEVLLVYGPIDDFVMNNIGEFSKRKIVSAELEAAVVKSSEDSTSEEETTGLSTEDSSTLTSWLAVQLEDSIKEVKITSALSDSPAMITAHESASIRKMMAMINETQGGSMPSSKPILEINPQHPILIQLHALTERDPELSTLIARQLYDNAALAAGLIDDGRVMLPRLTLLLEKLLAKHE